MIKICKSEQETALLAAVVAKGLRIPTFIALRGNLGSGKTFFTKKLAQALHIPEAAIKSPTYTFVREYKISTVHFYHFDFYRIEGIDEIISQELTDIFSKKDAIIVVEWPEHIEELLPANRMEISFEYLGKFSRKITVN